MENIKNFIEGNVIFNIVMFIIAIASIIITIYIYIRSRKDKKPTYIIRTINLIRDTIKNIDNVKILYKNDTINNLSISKIALWNDGKETINSADVAPIDPIKIAIKNEYDILYADFLYKKNEVNNFKYEIASDKKTINITFDYFDFEEGFILQIFHTGNSSLDLCIKGTIKTVKKIIRNEVTAESDRKYFFQGICFLLFVIIAAFILGTIPFSTELWFFSIIAILSCVYIRIGYKSIKRKIPKGFDIFNEEFLVGKNSE